MIEKKDGIINNIIDKHTVYNDGKHRYYPTLFDLSAITDDIVESNETTDYIHLTPFYMNSKRGGFQEEFDFYDLYIECRDEVTQIEKEAFPLELKFWGEESDYILLNDYVDDEDLTSCFFLLQKNDTVGFQEAIRTYLDFVDKKAVSQWMKWLKEKCDLTDEEIPYGYFCFEIHSE